jgi:mRNA interferase HicA
VTASALRRKLQAAGCTFEDGKKHTIVHLGNKRTIMPRHGSKEIKTGTYRAILKDLGLEEK